MSILRSIDQKSNTMAAMICGIRGGLIVGAIIGAVGSQLLKLQPENTDSRLTTLETALDLDLDIPKCTG